MITSEDFRINAYESPALRAVTGPALRPGGLDLTRRAMAICRLPAGARVLDAGCGPGASIAWLSRNAGLAAFGLDRSGVLLADARQACPGLPLVRADAACLPFAGGEFDLVLTECVLSLLNAPDRMLAECHRVLAPDAWLVLTDLYLRNGSGETKNIRLPASGCLAGARGRAAMEQMTTEAGFETTVWEDHTDRLKRLAADLVWTCGSLAPFRRDIAGKRLGFCLMICRRREPANG